MEHGNEPFCESAERCLCISTGTTDAVVEESVGTRNKSGEEAEAKGIGWLQVGSSWSRENSESSGLAMRKPPRALDKLRSLFMSSVFVGSGSS